MVIAAVASLLSVVVIALVTYIVNWSMVQERDKVKDLRRIVRDINIANTSALKVDQAQNQNFDALNTNLKQVNTDLKQVTSDVSTLNDGMQDVKTNVTSLKDDMNTATTDIKGMKSKITSYDTDISKLKGDVSSSKTDITGIKSTYALKSDLSKQFTSDLGDFKTIKTSDINFAGSNLTLTPGTSTTLQTKIDNSGNMYIPGSQFVKGRVVMDGFPTPWQLSSSSNAFLVNYGLSNLHTSFNSDGNIYAMKDMVVAGSHTVQGNLTLGSAKSGAWTFQAASNLMSVGPTGSATKTSFLNDGSMSIPGNMTVTGGVTASKVNIGPSSFTYDVAGGLIRTGNLAMSEILGSNITLPPSGKLSFGSNVIGVHSQGGLTTPKMNITNASVDSITIPAVGKINIGTGVIDFDAISGAIELDKFKSTSATLDQLNIGQGSLAYETLSSSFVTPNNFKMNNATMNSATMSNATMNNATMNSVSMSNATINNATMSNIAVSAAGRMTFGGSNSIQYDTSTNSVITRSFTASNITSTGNLCIGPTCITSSQLAKLMKSL